MSPGDLANQVLRDWDAFNAGAVATEERRKAILGCLRWLREPAVRASVVQMAIILDRADSDQKYLEFFVALASTPQQRRGLGRLLYHMSTLCAALTSEDPETRKVVEL